MTTRYNPDERAHMEAVLASRAENLLRERARKLGTSPRRLLNQIVPEEVAKPRKPAGGVDSDAVIKTLLQRLAERD